MIDYNPGLFNKQIGTDIHDIQEEYGEIDSKLSRTSYAFNYWILINLLHKDISECKDLIEEYNDKGVDCFGYFKEDKELFLIQSKYYGENTSISREDVSYFLNSPLEALQTGTYSRSKELQKIFTDIKNDSDAVVHLFFCCTTEKKLPESTLKMFDSFNRNRFVDEGCTYKAEFLDLKKLYDGYYERSYTESQAFTFKLKTYMGKGYAAINEEYKLDLPYEAYYIITPVLEIFRLLEEAEAKQYPIFDKNIREYLGESGINGEIIKTLRDEKRRKFFLYYNNGITVN
ncbi:MAG: AIPR family protein [Spirochaetia bacterium]|jgi:hypothetical protein|nr:AIPR family protein [Spirochaetia bacterium]